MKKGVYKFTACCMAGMMVLGNMGVSSLATGFDTPLAGMGAEIVEGQKQKEAAGVVKVAPTKYDTIAIAQVEEYVNIRDAASTETGNVVGKLYNNCKAEILGQTNGWYLIKSGDVTGYVSSDYFVTGAQAEQLAKEVGTDMATVREGTETLMVRSTADSSSDAVSMVGDSEKLRVLEDNGDWVKVSVDDDVVGYVSKEYVDCDTEFVEAESVEQVEARKAAIQDAYDRAIQMQEAAYAAMNVADGNEAAYAADQANAALAEAKMLASQQEFDYEAKELADQVADIAQDTTVASVWAQEAEAEYERIAAEEAAAQAAAEAEAARQQAEAEAQAAADAAYQASLDAQNYQVSADNQEQLAQQKEQEAAQAWQDAVDAQNQANANWSEEAQAEADAATQAAAQATAEAEAARQQAEAEAQAAAEAEAARQQAEAEARAAAEAEAARQQAEAEAAQQPQEPSGGESTEGSSSEGGSSEEGSASSGSSSIRQSVVNYALQFVGYPYVYGGNSLTNGTDCSGFVKLVMAEFGVSLPRVAAAQAGAGSPVSLDAIQPGDLLFYNSGGGIGHVSMYIGNGQVVHASNETTGIIVSDINYRTACSARSFF